MEPVELAIRCYTEPVKGGNRTYSKHDDLPNLRRVLVFDTETTVDQFQNLTFGTCQIYERDKLIFHVLFYGDVVNEKQLTIIKEYSERSKIIIMGVREFVDRVFLPEVYNAHTPCIGFNLPFDLSRLAISWGNARGWNEGGFSFKLTEDSRYPRLVVKHLDSTKAFIQFTNGFSSARGNARGRKGSNRFRGHFLDLRTLTFALTNEKLTLDRACRHFGAEIGKTATEDHGKITREYLEYNTNDVHTTYSLFKKTMIEFEKYHLDISPTKLYSPASIGKAYFRGMGLKPFLEKNPEFSKEVLGYVMATYFGGRSEVRIRKTPVKINLIDFLSMYPTMCIVQNLWKFVIAQRVEQFEDTETVRKFIEESSLESFSDRGNWKKLNAICLVQPNQDILPVRCKYGDKNTYNIGLNHLTSEEPIWYSLADVIGSKLLTKKTPTVLKAIRFVPEGVQEELENIKMIGNRMVDPTVDDFFVFLMEYRDEIKRKRDDFPRGSSEYCHWDSVQNVIKIITNSSSYGIFVEINSSKKEDSQVQVYGNSSEPFINVKDTVETFGQEFNPIVSTLITSASRLVLAITEAILVKYGETYAFCDTDSMAIPPNRVDEVQSYFQRISPYSFKDPLFKIEKENFTEGTEVPEPVWFYGISAKRYVLYNMHDGHPLIRKYSLHGLGHIKNPFSQEKTEDWQKEIWQDILDLQYGHLSSADLHEKYADLFAVSQITVSSPEIINRFKITNAKKAFHHQIKPFNFALLGIKTIDEMSTEVKPIAPFNKKYQSVVYRDFINYSNGMVMSGKQYWRSMDSIFFDYLDHGESKFEGIEGVLNRRSLIVRSMLNIGKESNNIEETESFGVSNGAYQTYVDEKELLIREAERNDFILGLKTKLALVYGIDKQQLIRMKKKLRDVGKLKLSTKINKKVREAFRNENTDQI